jgi:hypothetical protein
MKRSGKQLLRILNPWKDLFTNYEARDPLGQFKE